MKYLVTTFLLLLSSQILIYSQEKPRIVIDVPTNQKPWNTVDWNDSKNQFQFAIVTDRTGGHRPGVFMKGIRKLNLLQPEFVMSVGDLIEGYTTDVDRLDAEWKEFNSFIDSLQTPFFYVPGNHDITNEVMDKKWKELFGVTYYHFIYKDVLFLCMNSEDNYRGSGRGTVDDEQYEYVKKILEENKNVKWTLVFIHQPLWVQEDTKRWKDVEKLLEDRDHNVFAGHYHRYWKTERNNGKYIALATTGGFSRLRGTAYGEFDHVVWVTMTENGPMVTNLLLDGIFDENVVTEDIVDLVRNKPFPVQIEPLYLENNRKDSIRTTIKIINSSDYQMSVNLKAYNHPSVFYKIQSSKFIVEPNDVVKIDLAIINREKQDITTVQPIHIDAEVKYDYRGSTDLVLNNKLNFVPLHKYKIEKAVKRIKIDGNLKEWKTDWFSLSNHKGRPFDFSGPSDLKLKFGTSYDDEFLYLAFKITDNDLLINNTVSLWQQDALIVGLDARPKHISTINNGEGRGKDWLLYLRAFKQDNAVYHKEWLPKGTVSSYKKTENGINIELGIPLTYLEKMQLGSWKNFRLGVGYYDFDKNEQPTEYFWYPSWDSKNNIPGSGMFFKN